MAVTDLEIGANSNEAEDIPFKMPGAAVFETSPWRLRAQGPYSGVKQIGRIK